MEYAKNKIDGKLEGFRRVEFGCFHLDMIHPYDRAS